MLTRLSARRTPALAAVLAPLLTPLLALLLAIAPLAATGEPARYEIDMARSKVSFEVMFGKDAITGTIPIVSADIRLDPRNPANSAVKIELDNARAVASFPFATQAMRGPKVFDAANHPHMRFVSERFRLDGFAGTVEGALTLRGQTRPVTLKARIYRQQGSQAGDLSRLTVELAGSVRRSDFGATGWADMVSDEVAMHLLVRLDRAP